MDLSWKDLALDGGQSSDFGYSSLSQRELEVIEDRTFRCHVVVCSGMLIGRIGRRTGAQAGPHVGMEVHSWDSRLFATRGRQAVLVHDLPVQNPRVETKSGFPIDVVQ